MDDIRAGKIYAAVFALFLVIFAVGGYFGVVFLTKDNQSSQSKQEESVSQEKEIDNRIDKDQDFIYFTNIEKKETEREIIYQDVVFNFDSNDAKEIEEKLNTEMSELKESFLLISNQNLSEEEKEQIIYQDGDVYQASYQNYTRYFYQNYASLVTHLYGYDCFKGAKQENSKSYVFDTETGKLLSKSELLAIYGKTLNDLKDIIKERLEKEQKIVEEIPQIDITSTLNSLDDEESYALYINKGGYLVADYLVKSVQEDYNDVIILN